jgi:hypothetical protein
LKRSLSQQGVTLKQNDQRSKIRRGWLAAACALGVLAAGLSVRRVDAQATASGSESQKKAGSLKAANPAPTKSASAKASAGKTRTAATSVSANKKSRSSTSGSHNSKTKLASSRTGAKSGGNKTSRKKPTARGQQKIDPERAQAIQEALIREHYLSGDAAGSWNQACEDAMRKYQADHGWQSKTVPDSRALISLGLGPSQDHLLNPESAMTTGPDHAGSVSSSTQSPV